MTMHAGGWTDARVKVLRSMWRDGFSAGLIARSLGEGVTRSAVIGKVHRLKLEKRRTVIVVPQGGYRRGTPFSSTRQPKRTHRPELQPDAYVPPPSAWEPIPGTSPIGLLDLTDKTCRWPLGESPFRFCGCQTVPGSSYCAAHTVRGTQALTPVSKRGVMKYHPGGDFRRLQRKVGTGPLPPLPSVFPTNNTDPLPGSNTPPFHGAGPGEQVLADRADLHELST